MLEFFQLDLGLFETKQYSEAQIDAIEEQLKILEIAYSRKYHTQDLYSLYLYMCPNKLEANNILINTDAKII